MGPDVVEYQQARGWRAPGVRPDGTFTATASKTLPVAAELVFAAFVDVGLRERWLGAAVMHERTSRPMRSVRFDWEDGATRVNVSIHDGGAKSVAAVEHERLPDAEAAERMKSFWRDRLNGLKSILAS